MSTNTTKVTLEVTSRFMQNYEQKSKVSNHQQIGTGTTSDNKVLFFSVGDDLNLYVFQQDEGAATGWSSINLTEQLDGEVHHFAVAQDTSGNPVVAISILPTGDQNNSLVYHTKDLSAANANRWLGWGKQPQIGKVQKFAVGVGSANNETYIAFAALKNSNVTTYFVNANATTWSPDQVDLPENAQAVLDLKIGHFAQYEQVMSPGEPPLSQASIYTLFKNGNGDSELITETIPGAKRKHSIAVDADAQVIGLTPDANGDTQLFVGSKNLYFYDIKAQSSDASTATEAGAYLIGQFDETIDALAFDKNIPTVLDIWARTAAGNLYVAHEQNGNWSSPIRLAEQVSPEVTTWKNPVSGHTDLFYVDGNSQLYYLRQDSTTTLWKQHYIKTELLDEMEEIECYSIQVKAYDDEGSPIANQNIAISASEVTQVLLNKKNYYLDQYTWVQAPTDAQGRLTILNRIDKISSPHIRLAGNFFSGIVEVMPYAETKANLSTFVQKMKDDPDAVSNQQVASWDKTTGKMTQQPLLQDQYKDTQNITSAHQALSQLITLTDTTNTLPPNVKVPAGQKGGSTLVTVGSSSGFNNRIDLASLQNYKFGLDFTGSKPAMLNASQVDQVLGTLQAGKNNPSGLWGDVVDLAGDAFHALANDLLQLKHFVIQKVDEGIQIIINTAEGLYNVVVQYAEQAWQAIEFVLKKVLGFVLKVLMKLLGFLFDWEAILRTKDALVAVTNAVFDRVSKDAQSAKTHVDAFFNKIKTDLVGKDLLAQIGANSQKKPNDDAQTSRDHPANHSDSTVEWVFDHLLNGDILSATVSDPFDDSTISDQLDNALANLAIEEIQTAYQSLEAIAQDISAKVGNASFAEIAEDIMAIIVEELISAIQLLIDTLFDILTIVINGLKSGFNNRIDIPIFTWLYENIIAPGSKFSILDGLALLLAIPITIVHEIATEAFGTKKAPFQGNETQLATNSIGSFKLALPGDTTDSGTQVLDLPIAEIANSDDPIDSSYLNSSFAFGGVCVSVIRFTSSLMSSIGSVKSARENVVFRILNVTFGWIGTACSYTNVGLGIAVSPKGDTSSKDAPFRSWFERTLTMAQILFPLLNSVGAYGKTNSPRKMVVGVSKTVCGVINFLCALGLYAWEVGDKKKFVLDDLGKFSETTLLSIAQVLGFPAAKIDDDKVKAVLVGTILLCGIGTASLNVTRAGFAASQSQQMHRAF
ncbi:MAG: hypothetical protein DHS20C18_37360 [Saprospiraceae bacterium]|nr:MAG: hypothetical protein DHS20C18_37360 [Saprospiraceae bacterium]